MKRILGKIRELHDYGGFYNFLKGFLHFLGNKMLQRKYGFDPWHLTPIEWRPYALEIVRQINQGLNTEKIDTVVEIGCGLGEILAQLKCRDRIGLDIEARVIQAAEKLHSGIHFRHGSFPDIKSEKIDVIIDVIIMVNFIHNIPLHELQSLLRGIIENNRIRYLVVDKVPYGWNHDLEDFFGGLDFNKYYQSDYFKGKRKIYIYKNNSLL